MKKCLGYTLLELLMSLCISIILLAFVAALISSAHKTWKVEREWSSLQENARFAAFSLRESISLAGFIGCAQLTPTLPIQNFGARDFDALTLQNSLTAYEGVGSMWNPPLPEDFQLKPKSGTDVIEVRHLSSVTSRLLQEASRNRLIVALHPDFESDDDVAVSNCQTAVLFHVNKVQQTTHQELFLSKDTPHSFLKGAEVGKLKTEIFFIETTARRDSEGRWIDSLFYEDESGEKSELVSGVSQLHVTCVDEGVPLTFKKPSQIADWARVRAVRLKLLLRSENAIFKTPRSYWFDGQLYTTSDGHLYHEVDVTVGLKNRAV
jgi:Tfp pilus assembly protein PilW